MPKNINGETIEIVKGDVNTLTRWIDTQTLPITLTHGEFAVPIRTENQRSLFVAGLTLGAQLTHECATKPSRN